MSTQAIFSSGFMIPSAVRFFRPAMVAAEAGSHPRPNLPMTAFASRISSSVTARTIPLQTSIARRHFLRFTGREISIGDLAHMLMRITGKEADITSDQNRLRPEKSEVERLLCEASLVHKLTGWKPKYTLEEGLEV